MQYIFYALWGHVKKKDEQKYKVYEKERIKRLEQKKIFEGRNLQIQGEQ